MYVFHSVRSTLRYCYETRRMGMAPGRSEHRKYPLHIDKNWEPHEISSNPFSLPYDLDPEENKKLMTKLNQIAEISVTTLLGLIDLQKVTETKDVNGRLSYSGEFVGDVCDLVFATNKFSSVSSKELLCHLGALKNSRFDSDSVSKMMEVAHVRGVELLEKTGKDRDSSLNKIKHDLHAKDKADSYWELRGKSWYDLVSSMLSPEGIILQKEKKAA